MNELKATDIHEPHKEIPERTIYQSQGVLVTNRKVTMGKNLFAVKNIGGVSMARESRRKFFPALGMIFFGMMTIGGLATFNASEPSAALFLILICGTVAVWHGIAIFSPRKYCITISEVGGMRKVFVSADKKLVCEIVGAIQEVLILPKSPGFQVPQQAVAP